MAELQVQQIANRQRMDVYVTGPENANRLLIYTGTAILEERFAVDNHLYKAKVDIVLGDHNIIDPKLGDNFQGNPFRMVDAVASVGLASIQDLGDSDNVTWAVDEATIEEDLVDSQTIFLKIRVPVAYQGEDTALLRISYQANVLAFTEPAGVEKGDAPAGGSNPKR